MASPFIYTNFFWHGQAEKALVSLSTCAVASKHCRLIGHSNSAIILMSWLFKQIIHNAYVQVVLSMNGQVPSVTRGLDVCMRLHLRPFLHEQAVKALARLCACATASKQVRLIDNMIRAGIS